jgi:hypothetical protein
MHLMARLAERGGDLATYRAVRDAADPHQAQHLVAGALPRLVVGVPKPAELEAIRVRLIELPEPPAQARLRRGDYLGAVHVFLLVFFSTFPVAIPFLIMRNGA